MIFISKTSDLGKHELGHDPVVGLCLADDLHFQEAVVQWLGVSRPVVIAHVLK